jgi:hypothetical protein
VSLGLSAFALYALTSSPFVLDEDVAEFQTLGAAGGIAHAGYPLLTLGLEAFHRLPLSTPAYRANLVSAAAGAVAVALAAWAARRLGAGRLAAAAAAAGFALSHTAWHEATRAEVYAFTLPFAAGGWLALEAARRGGGVRAWLACGALTGLALTGHLSALGLATVVAALAAWRGARGRLALRAALAAAGGLALGLAPLLLIPLRDAPGHPLNYIETTFDAWSPLHVAWADDLPTRLRRSMLLLSGRQFLDGGWFHPFMDVAPRLRALAAHLALNDLLPAGMVLAAAGAGIAVARRSAAHGGLAAWIAAVGFWLALGAFPNVAASFFLPALWATSLFVATGLDALIRRSRPAGLLAALLLAATPPVRLAIAHPPPPLAGSALAADAWRAWPGAWSPFRHDDSWERFGREALAALPPRAIVLACWNEGTTLAALRHAAGLRPDVEVRLTCDQPGRIGDAAAEARAGHRALYATIAPERLPEPARWEPAGRWPRGGLWRYRE